MPYPSRLTSSTGYSAPQLYSYSTALQLLYSIYTLQHSAPPHSDRDLASAIPTVDVGRLFTHLISASIKIQGEESLPVRWMRTKVRTPSF